MYEAKPVKVERVAKPAVSGDTLWNYLRELNYAKNWAMWPGKAPFYPGAQPHGAL
jgi:hypothetical protein